MKYLLDADTLIDYLKDRGNARPRITAMIEADEEVALCAITVAELYSGLSDKNAASGRVGSWRCRTGTSVLVQRCVPAHTARRHRRPAVRSR